MLFHFFFSFFLCMLSRDFQCNIQKNSCPMLRVSYLSKAWINSLPYISSFALYMTIQNFIHQSLYNLQPLEVALHTLMIFITFCDSNNLSLEKCHLFPDCGLDDSASLALGPHFSIFISVLSRRPLYFWVFS